MSRTLRQVLDTLSGPGLYDPGRERDVARILDSASHAQAPPWYVQGLVGAGAWLSAVMFLVFIFGSLFAGIREEGVFVLVGLIVSGGAVILIRANPTGIFITQFALAVGLAGQVMFAFGTGSMVDEVWAAAGGLCVLQIVLAAACANRVHRFMCVTIASASLAVLIFDLEVYDLLNLLVFLLASGCLAIMIRSDLFAKRDLRVIGSALAFSLLAVLFLSTLTGWSEMGLRPMDLSWWGSTLGLLLLLLTLQAHTLRTLGFSLTSNTPLVLAGGTVILAILAWRSPGILGGLLVLSLGFLRIDRVLMGLGLAYLPVFLTAYYYHLSLTLLQKSGALLGPGLLLLAFRFILRRRLSEARAEGGHA